MRIKNIRMIIGYACLSLLLISCNKYLDKKPNQSLSTPSTLDDLSKLLINYDFMNTSMPTLAEISADNYYLTDEGWTNTRSDLHRHLYLWQKFDDVGGEWSRPYTAILNANVILENLSKVPLPTSIDKANAEHVRGMALFIRAYNHYALSQVFMVVYDKQKAQNDLGIPLKKRSDINETVVRASSAETYDFIINDVKESLALLPRNPDKKYLPSLPAAYGLLSRVYLSMQMYPEAGKYADSCLQLYSNLIDYNSIDAASDAPLAQFNAEDIYDTECYYPNALNQGNAKVDSVLYMSFEGNDIRKKAFFSSNGDGSYFFKGNYTGKPNNPSIYTGIATDEMYLTRAECFARQGDSTAATSDLNILLKNRFIDGKFIPISTPVAGGLLKLILAERRKELMYRALRWTDLRRLNKEPAFAETLYRFINGKKYELLPGSNGYTLQIDRRTILNSGVQQNP